MGADMLIMSIGLKTKDRYRVDEEWAISAFDQARQAISAIDEAKAAEITGNWRRSYEDLDTYKRTLIADLTEVESAVFCNHRQAATTEGGGGIILLLSGGLSWGDSPTELFESMSRLLEADVFPDARWPKTPETGSPIVSAASLQQFDSAVEGLREYYPGPLRDASIVEEFRTKIRWPDSGAGESEYLALKDQVERMAKAWYAAHPDAE